MDELYDVHLIYCLRIFGSTVESRTNRKNKTHKMCSISGLSEIYINTSLLYE